MKTRTTLFRTIIPILFVVAVFAVSSARAQQASEVDRAAVEEANEKFFAALNAMFAGDPTPMQDVWWHTEDIVYMGTGGNYLVGWKEIDANWEKKASLNLGSQAKAEQVQTTIVGDLAVTSQYIVADKPADGQQREIKPRATSVFRKQDGQWKMICHHVDVIPTFGEQMQNP
jgi:ketosteroid isomerase-like protein